MPWGIELPYKNKQTVAYEKDVGGETNVATQKPYKLDQSEAAVRLRMQARREQRLRSFGDWATGVAALSGEASGVNIAISADQATGSTPQTSEAVTPESVEMLRASQLFIVNACSSFKQTNLVSSL